MGNTGSFFRFFFSPLRPVAHPSPFILRKQHALTAGVVFLFFTNISHFIVFFKFLQYAIIIYSAAPTRLRGRTPFEEAEA
jgi:hypothetical protein